MKGILTIRGQTVAHKVSGSDSKHRVFFFLTDGLSWEETSCSLHFTLREAPGSGGPLSLGVNRQLLTSLPKWIEVISARLLLPVTATYFQPALDLCFRYWWCVSPRTAWWTAAHPTNHAGSSEAKEANVTSTALVFNYSPQRTHSYFLYSSLCWRLVTEEEGHDNTIQYKTIDNSYHQKPKKKGIPDSLMWEHHFLLIHFLKSCVWTLVCPVLLGIRMSTHSRRQGRWNL